MFMRRENKDIRAAALSLRGKRACYGELQWLGAGWRLVNAQEFETPPGCMTGGHISDGARLGAFLRKQIRWGAKKIPFVLGIPTSECLYQLISLPAANCDEAREAVKWKFSEYFPFAHEDALFDVSEAILPVPEKSGITVLAAAAMKKELLPLFDELGSSSGRLCAAEPLAAACARALTPPAAYDSGAMTLLAFCLEETAQFVLLNGGTGLLFRSCVLEDSTFTADDVRNDFRNEVRKTLDYAQSRFGCTPAVAYALPERLKGLADEAAGQAETAPVSISPLHRLEICKPAEEHWYDVAGLLLRYANEDGV